MKTLLLAAVFAVASSAPQSVLAQEDEPYYIYIGGDVRAAHRNQFYPVIASDGNKLLVEGAMGLKRVNFNSDCGLTPSVELSKGFMTVEEFDYHLMYRKKLQLESELISGLQQNSFQADVEIAQQNSIISDASATSAQKEEAFQEIQDIEYESSQLEDTITDAIVSDEVGVEGAHDTVFAKMTLMPSRDVSNAYCAVVVSFEGVDPDLGGPSKQRTVVRLRKVGDLMADIPQKFSFSVSVGEHLFKEAQCDLYFFSGDGNGIATNMSRGLKRLTDEQLERYRKLAGE